MPLPSIAGKTAGKLPQKQPQGSVKAENVNGATSVTEEASNQPEELQGSDDTAENDTGPPPGLVPVAVKVCSVFKGGYC